MRTKRRAPVKPFPRVTAKVACGDKESLSEEEVRGLFCNPIYAGVGPYPQIIDDETWVAAAAAVIRDEGPEQFLVNMLYVLRQSLGTGVAESKEQ